MKVEITFKYKGEEYTKEYGSHSNSYPEIVRVALMENLWDEITSIKKVGPIEENNFEDFE
jgi:hypothetical protein